MIGYAPRNASPADSIDRIGSVAGVGVRHQGKRGLMQVASRIGFPDDQISAI